VNTASTVLSSSGREAWGQRHTVAEARVLKVLLLEQRLEHAATVEAEGVAERVGHDREEVVLGVGEHPAEHRVGVQVPGEVEVRRLQDRLFPLKSGVVLGALGFAAGAPSRPLSP
jgi:hypothetical protein